MSAPYLGDFPEDATVSFSFTTNDGDGGAVGPSSAFEAADLKIFKDGSDTEKTAVDGITITSAFNGTTGLHMVVIDTSDDTNDAGWWVIGSDFEVVLVPDETVDGETVVAVIARFSIENRYTDVTNIGGSAAAGELEAAATASLVAHNLDHLALTATGGADMTTEVADNTILSRVLANGDTSAFVPSTDGLQPVRDEMVSEHGALPTAAENRAEMDSNSTELAKIGTIPALDGGAQTIGGAIAKLADDNGGADFDAGTDSLEKIQVLLQDVDDEVDAIYDATQGLSGASGGISTAPKAEPDGFVITTGESEANDEDSTHALDGTTHDVLDTGDALEVYYEFLVGGAAGIPIAVSWDGYVQGQGNTVAVKGYDFGNTAWVQVGTITGTAGTTVIHEDFPLTTNLVESGVGTVRIQFSSADVDKLATDRILAEYTYVISAADIVNEWESQSQADPTGFHVNLLEIKGGAVPQPPTAGVPKVNLVEVLDVAATASANDLLDVNVKEYNDQTATTSPGNLPDVNVKEIADSATAATLQALAARGVVTFAAEGVPSTTVIQTDLTEATDDHYKGRVAIWITGACAGQGSPVTAYTGATGTLTVTAMTTAPAATNIGILV